MHKEVLSAMSDVTLHTQAFPQLKSAQFSDAIACVRESSQPCQMLRCTHRHAADTLMLCNALSSNLPNSETQLHT